MKRKVNLVGNNTLTVSLPSKWAEKYNVKKGDEVELSEEIDGSLIISRQTIKEIKHKEIRIEISKDDITHIRSFLGSIYRKGYDKVLVSYSNPEVYKKIVDACESLMGYEVVDVESKKCIIKNMILEENVEFDSTLRRIIFSLKSMNSNLIEDIQTKKFDKLEDFKNMRVNMWKLRDYALRLIEKKNLFNENNFDYSLILWVLEKVTSQYQRIYENIVENKKKNYVQIIPILKKFEDLIDLFEKILYKKDLTLVPLLDDKREILIKECNKLYNEDKTNDIVITYIVENIRRIFHLKSSLVAILLEPS